LLRPLAQERLAGDDRRAERDNACKQYPAGDGVETIVHEDSLCSRGREGLICAALYGRVGATSSGGAGALGRGQAELDCAPVERRQAGVIEPVERLPPTLANRFVARLDTEFQREMGEDVADRSERPLRRSRSLPGPLGPRQRGHPAEQALRRPADQPDVAVALDPPGDAVA